TQFFPAVLRQTFGRTNTSGILVLQIQQFSYAGTRIVNGGTSEYVPFVDPAGPAEQHIVFIESTNAFRTNVGFVTNEPASAEVTIYDSEGRAIDQRVIETPRGV